MACFLTLCVATVLLLPQVSPLIGRNGGYLKSDRQGPSPEPSANSDQYPSLAKVQGERQRALPSITSGLASNDRAPQSIGNLPSRVRDQRLRGGGKPRYPNAEPSFPGGNVDNSRNRPMAGGSRRPDHLPETLTNQGEDRNSKRWELERRKQEWNAALAARNATTTTPRYRTTPRSSNNAKKIIEALLNKLQQSKARPQRPGPSPAAPPASSGYSLTTVVSVVCCVCLGVTFAGVAALVAWNKCRGRKGAGVNSYEVNYGARFDEVNVKMPNGLGAYPNATYRQAGGGHPPAYPYPERFSVPALEVLQKQQQSEAQPPQPPTATAASQAAPADATYYSQLE